MALKAHPAELAGTICRTAPEQQIGSYAVDGLTPAAAAFPESPEQVAEIVRLAGEHKWALIPRGGGTQMALGNMPRAADVAVCTTAMNRVLEYEPADLVVTVQAGIRLAELQHTLAEHGQFLALDPPLPERATIGGIIAANSSGPLRLRYGTCRDMLLGIKVVNADGNITKGGGKVVKNVTGYDMGKLYTGSLGTLGIIVEASFKVAALPPVESTVLARFDSLDAAYTSGRAIYKSALPILACELLSPAAARALDLEPGWTIAVWLGAGPAAVQRQERDVIATCGTATSAHVLDEPRGFWRALEDFGRGQFETIAKISVLPSRVGELLARLPDGDPIVSHVLSGVTYLFSGHPEATAAMVRELGGYLVVEACPPELKRRLDVWGPPGPDFRLMRRVKREFDPDGILNPGRYVGGL